MERWLTLDSVFSKILIFCIDMKPWMQISARWAVVGAIPVSDTMPLSRICIRMTKWCKMLSFLCLNSLSLRSDGDQRDVHHYGDTWSLGINAQTVWAEPTESAVHRSMFRFGQCVHQGYGCGPRILLQLMCQWMAQAGLQACFPNTHRWQRTNWISTLSF